MPKFREIDEPDDYDIEDIENLFRRRRITIEERDSILRKSKEKLVTSEKVGEHTPKIAKTETHRESKVEKVEVSSEIEFEQVRRNIQEYDGTEEEFEELMDEISGSFDEVHSDVIEKERSDRLEVATEHDSTKIPSASPSTPNNGVCSSVATKGKKSWIKVKTLSEFNVILNRHQWLCDEDGFPNRYERVVKYFLLKEMLVDNPDIPPAESARILNIPEGTIRFWTQEESPTSPILMKVVLDNERVLRRKEASISQEYGLHHVSSSKVYKYFEILGTEGYSIERVAEIIPKFMSTLKNRLLVAEFAPYNKTRPSWLRTTARKISKDRVKIMEHLAKNGFPSIKVAVLDDKLYLWKQTTIKKHFEYMIEELFYFSNKKRKTLIKKAVTHLGNLGIVRFSKIITQLTGYTFSKRFPVDSINADLKPEKTYLSGRTLHLIMDILNEKLENHITDVKKIGRQDQIKNPRLLEDTEFFDLMTRLFAIIGSDGHIQRDIDRVQYSEWNYERRQRVKELLGQLGDIVIRYNYKDGRITRLVLPSVLGRLLNSLGMPTGDKVMQGFNLPDFIMNGRFSTKCGYVEEVLPEEACISIRPDGYAYVLLGRRVVLQDPSKENVYELASIIEDCHVELIQKHGTKRERTYGADVIVEHSVVLYPTKLRELSRNIHTNTVASKLLDVVTNTPPKLLMDERKLFQSVGINTTPSWKEITLYESGRVSVLWELRTTKQIDTALWGVLTPPNDLMKFEKFQSWLKTRPDLVERANQVIRDMKRTLQE